MEGRRVILKGALVLLRRPGDGRVLAISRGHDTGDWALPGGAPDVRDLTAAYTAARELREETGVRARGLVPVFAHNGVVTFAATSVPRWPAELRSRPFEGYVAWVAPAALTAPSATYAPYARRLFAAVGATA